MKKALTAQALKLAPIERKNSACIFLNWNYTQNFLKFCYTSEMMIDNSIKHIQNALKELDKEVEKILLDWSIPLNEKDNLMLPILQQKKVLDQTLEDLTYLKEHPPTPNQPCGISKYREE